MGIRKDLLVTEEIPDRICPLASGVYLPILPFSASAADQEKDEDRLANSGTVLKEVLDVPDDIPHDLLDKADCVVVFQSVLKAAFIVGGKPGNVLKPHNGSRTESRRNVISHFLLDALL